MSVEVMNHFTETLGLSHYSVYMQDYGGPVWLSRDLDASRASGIADRSGRGGA